MELSARFANAARWPSLTALLLLSLTQRLTAEVVTLPWIHARPVGIHEQASWQSRRLGWLRAGETATVADKPSGNWIQVTSASGIQGYVDLDWVEVGEGFAAGAGSVGKAGVATASEDLSSFVHFERLETGQGLPHSSVLAICQDLAGYIWLGGDAGLTRYDGDDFRNFFHTPGDPSSPADSFVRALVAEPSGSLWVGTNEGLQSLDPRTGKFTAHYKHEPQAKDSLSHDIVTHLYVDSVSRLWVGTEGGLCRFNAKTRSFVRHSLENHPEHRLIHSVVEVAPDRYWVLASGADDVGSLTELDLGTSRQTTLATASPETDTPPLAVYSGGPGRHPPTQDPEGFAWSPGIRQALARSRVIIKDREGDLWFGTLIQKGTANVPGLIRRSSSTKSYLAIDLSSDLEGEIVASPPNAVYEDRWGDVWAGLNLSGGVVRVDRWTGRCVRYCNAQGTLNDDSIRSVFEDRGGVLWIGTHAFGLCKLSPFRLQETFRHYRPRTGDSTSFSFTKATGLTVDKAGLLWIASESGGVTSFDRRKQRFKQFNLDAKKVGIGLASRRLWKVYQDRSQGYWLSSLDGRLQTFRPDSGEAVSFELASQAAVPFVDLLDDGFGNLWVATVGMGLAKFDLNSQRFVLRYTTQGPLPEEESTARWVDRPSPGTGAFLTPASDQIYCVRQDRKNPKVLWVGSEMGLLRFDLLTEEFRHVTKKHGLSHNSVLEIHQDSANILWLGTGGGGISQFDPQRKTFKTYTVSQGLPSNTIYGILQDASERLWVMTNLGLALIDKKSERIRSFDTSDGLVEPRFSQGSWAVDGVNGEMFFGGNNGFFSVYPQSLRSYRYKPSLVLSRFQLSYKDRELQDFLDEKGMVALNYDDIASFKCAALSFAFSSENRFRYKVRGFQDEWVELGTNRMVTLQNIPGGEYELQVQGSNYDGVWNDQSATLLLRVKPPWWKSKWAYFFYAFCIISALVIGLRYQEARMRRMREINRLADMERSLELTGAIQSGFLPQQSRLQRGKLTITGFYQAADKASGDWWWYEDIGEESYCALVGDVTGHGPGPAILTAAMATAFRVYRASESKNLEQRLRLVNTEVLTVSTQHLITVSALEIHNVTGRVSFYGLGGLPAMLLSGSDGKVSTLGQAGTPLGTRNLMVGRKTVNLNPGDRLLLATDGFQELVLPSRNLLGKQAARRIFQSTHRKPVEEALRHMVKCIEEARSNIPLDDDVTIVLVDWA